MASIRSTHPSEYRAWQAMKQRCYNPRTRNFDRYGGRGIVVCEQWRESSVRFLEDMGPKPTPKHSLDRIDIDGPYSPDNCRWATNAEQARNRSDSHFITHNGETMCLQDWGHRTGIPTWTIKYRLDHGFTVEEALTAPAGSLWSGPVNRKLRFEDAKAIRNRYIPRDRVNGARAIAREYGVSQATITKIVTGKTYPSE